MAATAGEWIATINEWETRTKQAIKTSQEAFRHEKYCLQLHLEANPVPFRPSSILSHLIRSEQRRGISTRQQRQRAKSVEHLERKWESEIQQHYELESAQACVKWKKLHLHLINDRRLLSERIESEAKRLASALQLPVPDHSTDRESVTQYQHDDDDDEEAQAEFHRLQVEAEWIHQERFNIQEAFTNQSKKMQADHKAFIDQLDGEFLVERQKILQQAPPLIAVDGSPQRRQQAKSRQFERQFKSNTKRHMLVQTAPVVELHTADQNKVFMTKPDADGSNAPAHLDITVAQRQLQELEQRVATYKESADGRLKEGMQWIGRQCAHMFSQLDSKEAEAKLIEVLTRQNMDDAHALRGRVTSKASLLRAAIHSRTNNLPKVPARDASGRKVLTSTENASESKKKYHPQRRDSEPIRLLRSRNKVHTKALP